MERKIARRLLQSLVVIAVIAASFPPYACGPYIPEAVFALRRRPDFPLADYAAGRLGIVQPSYDRSFLVVAYRHLTGVPLTPEEAATFARLWDESSDSASLAKQAQPVDWLKAWQTESARVLGKDALVGQSHLFWSARGIVRDETRGQAFVFYYNCLADGFRTAIDTLHDREQRFGIGSEPVVRWTNAQNRVFTNCAARGNVTAAVLPDAASPDDPPLIRADRAYQIAAAHFYAGDLDAAMAGFETIARDSSSPWHGIAPLLAARALVRRATLNAEADAVLAPDLENAAARLQALLDDPAFRDLHGAARRLKEFVSIRLRPSERRRELGETLSHAATDADREQELRDYLWLLEHSRNDTAAPDDLTDWVGTFQSPSADAFGHALSRWREHASPAWLVLALAMCRPADPAAIELLEAARRLPVDDPAKVMADYHRLRLIAAAGKVAEARRGLDEVLAHPPTGMTVSARNQMRGLRLRLAGSLREFLRFAPRTPVAVSYEVIEPPDAPRFDGDSSPPKGGTYFDRDSASVLNQQLSLATLAKVARDDALPAPLRREVAIAIWTRAVAIGRMDFARDVSPAIAALVPGLAADLERFRNAASPQEQRFAAAYTLLRFPGLNLDVAAGYPRQTALDRIDALRRNWWCAGPLALPSAGGGAQPSAAADSGAGIEEGDVSWTSRLPFLTRAEQERSGRELQALAALPAAPNSLARDVLEWSGSHPDDPRVPEALHLAVRATRYGCTDQQTTQYSRKAFERLHRRYPKSVWAQRTPYWF